MEWLPRNSIIVLQGLLTGTIKLKDSIMFLCRLEGFDLEVFYKGSVMVLPGFTVLVSEASGVLCL